MTPMQEFLKTAVSYTPEKATLAIETPFSKMYVEKAIRNMLELEIGMVAALSEGKTTFTIETEKGFIVVSNNKLPEAEPNFRVTTKIGEKIVELCATIFTTAPANYLVSAVLLDRNTLTWSRGTGITTGKPGQGPPAIGTKDAATGVEYSEIVHVIRVGKIEIGSGPTYQNGQMIGPDQGIAVKGRPGEPFRVVLKTELNKVGVRNEVYLEAPEAEPLKKEGDFTRLGNQMIEFDKAVLASSAEMPVNPERQYRAYIEYTDETEQMSNNELVGLKNLFAKQKNVQFRTFTSTTRATILEQIAKDKKDFGEKNVTIVIFALKAKGIPENDNQEKMRESSSYTVYMHGKSGSTYVPIRTCGMTALKIFNFLDLEREKGKGVDMLVLNQTVELVARGIAIISGTDYKDIINLIATTDDTGRLWLLKSGLILVELRPFDPNELDRLNRMIKAVRAAV